MPKFLDMVSATSVQGNTLTYDDLVIVDFKVAIGSGETTVFYFPRIISTYKKVYLDAYIGANSSLEKYWKYLQIIMEPSANRTMVNGIGWKAVNTSEQHLLIVESLNQSGSTSATITYREYNGKTITKQTQELSSSTSALVVTGYYRTLFRSNAYSI